MRILDELRVPDETLTGSEEQDGTCRCDFAVCDPTEQDINVCLDGVHHGDRGDLRKSSKDDESYEIERLRKRLLSALQLLHSTFPSVVDKSVGARDVPKDIQAYRSRIQQLEQTVTTMKVKY